MSTNVKWITCDIDTKESQDSWRIPIIASVEKVDRQGELVLVDGMDDSAYRLNPAIFDQHRTREAPIARAENLRKATIDGIRAYLADAVFFPDIPQSNAALNNVKAGLLSGISIGFLSLETGPPRLPGQTGPTHTHTQLLEISLVGVPACASCVVARRSVCSCDDVLPFAPSQADYALDTFVRTLASRLGKSIAPAVFNDLDEADIDVETIDKLLGERMCAVVLDSVRREVRKAICYHTGRVD